MGKETQRHGMADELAVIGELLASLVAALIAGTAEEVATLSRHLEVKAQAITPQENDPARLAAIATLRDRAALLVQTLFVTTDTFLRDALVVQERERGYRPCQGGSFPSTSTSRTPLLELQIQSAGSRISDLRA